MNVLVLGGYGLIGDAIVGRLLRDGHHVTGFGRDVREAQRRRPAVRWVAADISQRLAAEDWLPVVAGIDVVVNARRGVFFAYGSLAAFLHSPPYLQSSG